MHEEDILELCCGFIVADPETTILRLTHQTGQIFLQDQHSDDISPKRLDIATTCLRYLQFDKFEKWERWRDLRSWRAKYKALDYMVDHWGYHVKEVEESTSVQTAVLTYLACESKRKMMLEIKFGSLRSRGWTMLHVIAEFGLGTICKRVLEARQARSANRYSLFLHEFY